MCSYTTCIIYITCTYPLFVCFFYRDHCLTCQGCGNARDEFQAADGDSWTCETGIRWVDTEPV